MPKIVNLLNLLLKLSTRNLLPGLYEPFHDTIINISPDLAPSEHLKSAIILKSRSKSIIMKDYCRKLIGSIRSTLSFPV